MLIVTSGFFNDPVIANFRNYGFSGTIVKPFPAGTIVSEVQRLIRKIR